MSEKLHPLLFPMVQKNNIVVELTHSFATPKESKDIANVQRIRADYDQYFHSSGFPSNLFLCPDPAITTASYFCSEIYEWMKTKRIESIPA